MQWTHSWNIREFLSLLIDTAGIRRRGKIEPGVEKYSVLRSLQAIERADVALLMVDAQSGITSQDTHIAGFILDAWKSAVVLVNKWDLIEKDSLHNGRIFAACQARAEFYGLRSCPFHIGENRTTN